MLAELMARTGNRILGEIPPNGKDYWASRFWDRDAAEAHPSIRPHYDVQTEEVANLFRRYGSDADRVLEFCCGTGLFTKQAHDLTPAKEVVALDISTEGLKRTRARVGDSPRLKTVHGDFWADHNLGTAPLVVCMDAIHHLGHPKLVLERLKTFMAPGATFIGSLWTLDNFHELQRYRYGRFAHLSQTAKFLGSAVAIRATGGRLRSDYYRTRLVENHQVEPLLHEVFSEVLFVSPKKHHFTAFACKA
jgi:SAM-dependent methyltransferase